MANLERREFSALSLKPSAAPPAQHVFLAARAPGGPTRSLNGKVCIAFAVAALLSAGAIVGLHALQVYRHAGILKRQARRELEEKRYESAAKYFQHYLRYAPRDNAARIDLIGALDQKQDKSLREKQRLINLCEAVLREQPDDVDLRRRLVDRKLDLGRYADALDDLNFLLEGPRRDDGALEQLKALCLFARNEKTRAIDYYRKAVAHAPYHIPAYAQLADLYNQEGNPQDAEALMAKLIEQNKDDYQAYLARAGYLRQHRQAQRAAGDMQKAYQLAPQQIATLLGMAELAEGQKHFDEARNYLRKGLTGFPDSAALYLVLARVEMSDNHADKAVAALRQGVSMVATSGRKELLHQLGFYLVQRGRTEEVADVIKSLENAHAPLPVILDVRCQVLMAEEKWNQAASLLGSLRSHLAADSQLTSDVNLRLGRCYEKLGEPDQALAAYRQALVEKAQPLPARLGMANALVALRRYDEAIVEYQNNIIPLAPQYGPALAKLLVIRNLRVGAAPQDWNQIDDLLKKADPRTPETSLARAEILLARKLPEQAQAVLEAGCKEHPRDVALWLALADMKTLDGHFERGLAILQSAQESYLGDRVELRLARARYWTQERTRSRQDRAALLAGLEKNLEPFKPRERIHLLRDLGEIHYRTGDMRDARRLWRQVASLQPQDLPVRMALFDLALQTGASQEADEIADQIRDIEGSDGTEWRFAKACLFLLRAEQGNKEGLPHARKLLTEVSHKRGEWAPMMRSLALLEDLEGNQPDALKHFNRAFELGDRDLDALRRAIHLLYSRQQYEEADRLLRVLEEQGKLPTELLSLQASLRSQQGKHANAIVLARKVVEDGSKKTDDYIWLGQILWAAGEKYYQEAEEALRQATRLPAAEKSPAPWVALIHFLSATKQTPKAAAVLEEAQQHLAAGSEPAALAECYELTGQRETAAKLFETAARAKPKDFESLRAAATFYLRHHQMAKAAPYFARLLDPSVRVEEEERRWAQCFLAICEAHAGDFRLFEAARHFLEQHVESSGRTAESLRLLALHLSAHLHKREQARRLLEDLNQNGLLPADDQLLLGQLLESAGAWPKARELYANLAADELKIGTAKVPLATNFVLALTRHDAKEIAANWLDSVMQHDPTSWSTLDARVRVLKMEGRGQEAEKILRERAQQPKADLRPVAALFEEIGQTAAAEELYRLLAKQDAAGPATLSLAAFLGRQGRIDEALALCERAAKAGTAAQAAALSAAIVDASAAPKPQLQRVEQMLTDALALHPDSTRLLVHLAALQNQQLNYAEAVRLYREILKRDGGNVTAMNNLAFLLAYHQGRGPEALELINRAIETAGLLPDLLDTRALIALKVGTTAQALGDLDMAIQDAPSANLYFHRAQALLTRDRDGALANLKKAQELKLQQQSLHPLERTAYHDLLKALGGA